MNVCLGPGAGIRTATISSSGSSAFRFGPTRKSRSGTVREPPRRGELDLGAVDEQRRQRVARPGEAVPRLPPIVPRLRICGPPTVREASASASSGSASPIASV